MAVSYASAGCYVVAGVGVVGVAYALVYNGGQFYSLLFVFIWLGRFMGCNMVMLWFVFLCGFSFWGVNFNMFCVIITSLVSFVCNDEI